MFFFSSISSLLFPLWNWFTAFFLLSIARVKQTRPSAWKHNHHLLYYCYGEICSEFQIINCQVNFWKLSARLMYVGASFANVFALFHRKGRRASRAGPTALALGGAADVSGTVPPHPEGSALLHADGRWGSWNTRSTATHLPPCEDRSSMIKVMFLFLFITRGAKQKSEEPSTWTSAWLRVAASPGSQPGCPGTLRDGERLGVSQASSEKPLQRDECGGIRPEPNACLPTGSGLCVLLLTKAAGAGEEHRRGAGAGRQKKEI